MLFCGWRFGAFRRTDNAAGDDHLQTLLYGEINGDYAVFLDELIETGRRIRGAGTKTLTNPEPVISLRTSGGLAVTRPMAQISGCGQRTRTTCLKTVRLSVSSASPNCFADV